MDRIGAGMHVRPTLTRPPRARHGRSGWTAGAVRSSLVALAAALALGLAALRRVEIVGDSMEPTLVAGDRLVVLRVPEVGRAALLRPGRIVAVDDPRAPDRLLVKRVVGRATDGTLEVAGDNPGRSTDSRTFGPLAATSVLGIVVYRYRRGVEPGSRAVRTRSGPGG